MRKNVLLLFLVTTFALNIKAQQVNFYDHYFYNPVIYNPAFTGQKNSTNVMLINRSQWTDFKGGIQANYLAIDGVLSENSGIGAVLFNDKKGLNNRSGGSFLYSYRLKFNDETSLRFGLSAGVVNHSIAFSQAIVQNDADPILFSENQSKTTFDGNGGLAFIWKDLEVGVAVNQLLNNKVEFMGNQEVKTSFARSLHYINSIKYTLHLSKEKNINLVPLAVVRYVPNAPLQYGLYSNFNYKELFWVGAGYKSDYAVNVNAGIKLQKQLDVGYSYNIITSDIGQYSGISNEVMVSYTFPKKKKKIFGVPRSTLQRGSLTKLDSLQKIIENNKLRIEELEKSNLQNKGTSSTNNDAVVKTRSVKEFLDASQKTPEVGVYVVVGTFEYRELAIAYAQAIKKRGYSGTTWLYSKETKYNYVYVLKENLKSEALKIIPEAKKNCSPNTWLLILEE